MLLIIAFLFGVGSGRKIDKNIMTSEYNRGYRYGRQSAFAESYKCYSINNVYLHREFVLSSRNIAKMGEISLEDALSYPCDE